MLHIVVWCLPKQAQRAYKKLFDQLVGAVISVPEASVEGERDVLINFPADLMSYGLGTEIVCRVTDLADSPKLNADARDRLKTALDAVLRNAYPKASVRVRVDRPERIVALLPRQDVDIPVVRVHEFFSKERFAELGVQKHVITRACNTVKNMCSSGRTELDHHIETLSEFVAHYSAQEYVTMPNMGDKVIAAINGALTSVGIPALDLRS